MQTGRRLLLLAALLAAGLPRAAAGRDAPYAAIGWPALLPPDWDPQKFMDALGLDRLNDGDAEASTALKKLRAAWDAAPANPALDGRRARLWGYMVPLESDAREIRQFLLVPYFGACIHAPAPPANQMILVVPAKPFPTALRGTSAVWVSGTFRLDRSESELGVTTYRMAADLVEPYKP